eukprot:11165215-Ditylum_brightwellii.AAC.1
MEAILPRIMTPGKRQQRKGRKPLTLTPTELAGTETRRETPQLLMLPSLKMRIIPQKRMMMMMPLLDLLLFL